MVSILQHGGDQVVTRRNPEERPARRRSRSRGGGAPSDEGSPRSLSDEVEAQAQDELESGPAHQASPQEEEALDFSPKGRLDDVTAKAGAYEAEYRLQLIHRLLLRRIPLDQIASQLGVTVRSVQRYRQDLYKRLRKEARGLDINTFIGDTFGFYGEVTAMSLRAASMGKAPLNIRLAALRTALASRDRLNKFLGDAGVLDVLKYEPERNEGKADLEKIVDMTNAILDADQNMGIDLDTTGGAMSLEEDEDIHII